MFLTKEEERVEKEETTHEFTMTCELECEATKELLQLCHAIPFPFKCCSNSIVLLLIINN